MQTTGRRRTHNTLPPTDTGQAPAPVGFAVGAGLQGAARGEGGLDHVRAHGRQDNNVDLLVAGVEQVQNGLVLALSRRDKQTQTQP